jgi:hypothetical protein
VRLPLNPVCSPHISKTRLDKENAMPDSITVAAFVIGLVFLIAALIGKELKIAAVEMPALNSMQRLIVGVLGIVLVIFGLTEGQVFTRSANLQSSPTAAPASASAAAQEAAPTSSTAAIISTPPASPTAANPSAPPTQASLPDLGVALPPEFSGNIRSAKASYGCGILLGLASNNEEQLSVCGLMPNLPEEWTAKVKRVSVDCATIASDSIIVELWTEANYTGETWGYTFECP